MNNHQVQCPQIFNSHYLRTDYKVNPQPLVLNLNQSRQSSKALSVDRGKPFIQTSFTVKLKQANQNVEQLIDLWQRHKSITQTTPTNISQSFHYHSTTQKNESFVIAKMLEEIPETREVSPLKPEEIMIKPIQLFEINQSTSKLPTTQQYNSNHKKTSSLYVGALSKSDAFSGTKKAAKENLKLSNNGTSGSKKTQINSSSKKLPKELSVIVQQLQSVQKTLLPYYQKLEKGKKTEMDEQFNSLINQIKSDFTK
ncbi:unnamed protein product (macronuclear) [Paramecium tetraurelia]|uniref:Uncharacterized protein n=1 Tax=Paramecium tetraurelia TaxID=5888 RepID=A0CBR6_PARTE|nr:uncharacterized protein GSPATT00037016001 [Paramecium tetraurelia]CAK68233.1 unnamed protein product [Paramecium tetraurelia]|eukprot:XP_001435630.1 hypothetical protein (macronuclear) [Paramecium tetraurelia strain d4-2]